MNFPVYLVINGLYDDFDEYIKKLKLNLENFSIKKTIFTFLAYPAIRHSRAEQLRHNLAVFATVSAGTKCTRARRTRNATLYIISGYC
jgi:hypothetical protein